MLPTRQATNAAGWLVRAVSEAWQLHDEAERIRATRARKEQRHAEAQTARTREQYLAGWAGAVSDALTDDQLAVAVTRTTQPVGGLDRRSAPVAASQIFAWAITTAIATPDTPLDVALTQALHRAVSAAIMLRDDIPPPQATATVAPPGCSEHA